MKRYVIDTSSLIELMRTNPIDIYVTVWNRMGELVDGGRLIAPRYVLEEIHRIDDTLAVWANSHKRMFKQSSTGQIRSVTEILKKFPGLSRSDREGQTADPFVIAMALEKGRNTIEDYDGEMEKVVVSEEKLRGNKQSIPFVCQSYGIHCIGIHEMFREEGWKF